MPIDQPSTDRPAQADVWASPPKAPGFYWYRCNAHPTPGRWCRVVESAELPGRLWALFLDSVDQADQLPGEWAFAGPLTPTSDGSPDPDEESQGPPAESIFGW